MLDDVKTHLGNRRNRRVYLIPAEGKPCTEKSSPPDSYFPLVKNRGLPPPEAG